MTVETFELLRPYLKNIPRVYIGGIGEPLMNKNLVKFIKIIKKESPLGSVSFTSNATLLTKELSKELVNAGLGIFKFSLDGVDPMIVDLIRKGSSLTNILNNIKILKNIKENMKSRTPVINAVTVLQRKNYSQLLQIIELADELGVKQLIINHLEPYTEDIVPNILWSGSFTPKDIHEVLKEGIEFAAKKKISLRMAHFFPSSPTCSMIKQPVILANGDVVPCHVLAYGRDSFFNVDEDNKIIMQKGYSRKKCFGNIKENSLKEIWFSHNYIQFREKVLAGDFPDECSVCLMKHKLICG